MFSPKFSPVKQKRNQIKVMIPSASMAPDSNFLARQTRKRIEAGLPPHESIPIQNQQIKESPESREETKTSPELQNKLSTQLRTKRTHCNSLRTTTVNMSGTKLVPAPQRKRLQSTFYDRGSMSQDHLSPRHQQDPFTIQRQHPLVKLSTILTAESLLECKSMQLQAKPPRTLRLK